MAKVRHIPEGNPLPEWFLDALQESLSTYASPNFAVTILNPTTLKVVAGTGNDQRAVFMAKPDLTALGWRYITADITAAAPGTLVTGDNDVYVTANANVFTANPSGTPKEIDNTVYAFALKVLPPGTTPSGTGAESYYRKIAVATWSGAAFTDVRNLVGATAFAKHAATHNPGGSDALDWALLAQTIHLVGTIAARPAASSTNSGMIYLATDAAGGTIYRSSGSAWVQLAPALVHAASHQNGSTDPIDWHGAIHMRGTIGARPAYSATYAGILYFANDQNGGTLYRGSSTLSAWEQIAPAMLHAATHLASGTDPLDWTVVHASGLFAARPTAAAGNAGYFYFATDDSGGTMYRSTGSAWQQVARSAGGGATPTGPAGGDLSGSYPNPDIGAAAVGTAELADQAATRRKILAGLFSRELGLEFWEGVSGGFTSGDPRTALAVSVATGFQLAIAAGYALIQGDDTPADQGLYYHRQAATGNVTVSGPGANPRVDGIYLQFNDPSYTGRTPVDGNIVIAAGTPTAGATLANRNGAAAAPASALWLADVLVNPGDASVQAGNIADKRKVAGPAIWGEDGRRYRLGVDSLGTLGTELVV